MHEVIILSVEKIWGWFGLQWAESRVY